MMVGDAEHRAQVKQTYGFETWPRPEIRPARPLPLLPTTGMPLPFLDREAVANGYIDSYGGSDGILVTVWVHQFASPADAQEALIDYLMRSMSARLPFGSERDLDLGDISIAGHTEEHFSLVFVRNEMFVRIHSGGDQDYAVLEFARIVDEIMR